MLSSMHTYLHIHTDTMHTYINMTITHEETIYKHDDNLQSLIERVLFVQKEAAGDVKWVKSFVSKTFFGACRAHNGFHGNENKYCINCEQAACSHCLAEGRHANHKVIKIFRLVYMDVVSIDEMTAFLDCSKIQVFCLYHK